jgi:uncharacterized protein YcnI
MVGKMAYWRKGQAQTGRRLRRAGTAVGAAAMMLWVGVASAHVTVWPQTSTPGAWEKYTMRVPTERSDPTVKVVLKIPCGVELEQYEPVAGWKFSEQKNSAGDVVTATWTATNGGIQPGQFLEFPFVAKNPSHTGQVAWNAYQYYKDGTIVEWTGKPGSNTPHSITTITNQGAVQSTATGAHGAQGNTTNASGNAGSNNMANMPGMSGMSNMSTSAPSWLSPVSIVALLVSIVSLIVSILGWTAARRKSH